MILINLSSLPPSVNAMYRNVPGKGRVKTKQYHDWYISAGWELHQQALNRIKTEKYGLIISIKKRKNADITNYIKPIEDLLVAHAITPDDKNNIATMIVENSTSLLQIKVLDDQEAVNLINLI